VFANAVADVTAGTFDFGKILSAFEPCVVGRRQVRRTPTISGIAGIRVSSVFAGGRTGSYGLFGIKGREFGHINRHFARQRSIHFLAHSGLFLAHASYCF
jgi:hypothetical protein